MKYLILIPILFSACALPVPPPPAPSTSNWAESECYNRFMAELLHQPFEYPRHVYIDPELPLGTIQHTYEAAAAWNEAVGETVFDWRIERVDPRTHGTVLVEQMVVFNPERLASTEWDVNWAVAEIRADVLGHPLEREIIEHELGHALNLRHEEQNSTSVMRPVLTDGRQIGISELSVCLVQLGVEGARQ